MLASADLSTFYLVFPFQCVFFLGDLEATLRLLANQSKSLVIRSSFMCAKSVIQSCALKTLTSKKHPRNALFKN